MPYRGFYSTVLTPIYALSKGAKVELLLTGETLRFENSFDYDFCRLLKRSGCIAITGGLESADNRLLKVINKGHTIEQVIPICHNFSRTGILVHVYLIYGLPTEQISDFINSLEIIRQMFREEIIHSAYYHRFALSFHSAIYAEYKNYSISRIDETIHPFANNDVEYNDSFKKDFDNISYYIEKAMYNFNYKNCLDNPITSWFDQGFDKSKRKMISHRFVLNLINQNTIKHQEINTDKYPFLTASKALFHEKNGDIVFVFSDAKHIYKYTIPGELAKWLDLLYHNADAKPKNRISLSQIGKSFPKESGESFDDFLNNELFLEIRQSGMLLL